MVAVVKPRMHVDLLEEIAVGKASKPSTEMGAKMERAKELMDRGNAFMAGNQCDKAIDVFQEVISPSFDEMQLKLQRLKICSSLAMIIVELLKQARNDNKQASRLKCRIDRKSRTLRKRG